MLCKLIKLRGIDFSSYANESFDDIIVHICDGISDWEEVNNNEIQTLNKWVEDTNNTLWNKNKYTPYRQLEKYIIVYKPETTLKFCIQEQIKKEKEKIAELKKKENAAKQKREEAKKLQEKKRREKEIKLLNQLKEKYD